MTVKDLMEFLSHQPENLKIVSFSSDEEYHEVDKPRVVRMISNNAGEFFENKEGEWCIILEKHIIQTLGGYHESIP